MEDQQPGRLETITVGAGCFWCVEAVLEQLEGVLDAETGYMGGSSENPTYDEVCSGKSGHAAVVRVTFDPAVISCRELLEVFFAAHDPTTLNRQGDDVGTHVRSVIFTTDGQHLIAEELIAELTAKKVFGAPIVTSIEPASIFWRAEEEQQNVVARYPDESYCRLVVAPKVAKIRVKFAHRIKREPVGPPVLCQN